MIVKVTVWAESLQTTLFEAVVELFKVMCIALHALLQSHLFDELFNGSVPYVALPCSGGLARRALISQQPVNTLQAIDRAAIWAHLYLRFDQIEANTATSF